MENYWKEVYSHPENLVTIKLVNPTTHIRYVWIEPAAYMVELEPVSEYKLLTHDRNFSIEWASEVKLTLWLDTTVGFILYKLDNNYEWEVAFDCSDNQF